MQCRARAERDFRAFESVAAKLKADRWIVLDAKEQDAFALESVVAELERS